MGTIREATASDRQRVVELRLEFIAAERGIPLNSFSDALLLDTAHFVHRHHEAGTARSWLADVDGHDVGVVTMLTLDLPPRPGDRSGLEGLVLNMYVVPDHRRKGLARMLLQRCADAARTQGFRGLVLTATDDGRDLYEQVGFAHQPDRMYLDLDPGEP